MRLHGRTRKISPLLPDSPRKISPLAVIPSVSRITGRLHDRTRKISRLLTDLPRKISPLAVIPTSAESQHDTQNLSLTARLTP
ncbi:MAG: hypothetical protein IJQ58_09160 [Synergistaceae bacterium]|nr:hypothetical protein [Synergistaceae bacterium]